MNESDVSINDQPTLISLEGKAEDNAIRVTFSLDPGHHSSGTIVNKMRIGLSGNLELPSPLVITQDSEIYKNVPFHKGLDVFINSKSRSHIWFTDFTWE